MQIEWLSDDDTPLDMQEYEVYQAIDELTVGQRLEEGFAILQMN
jgi:hypothetical protein